ncbi:MAG: hypothetical protein RLY31_919 [Bacteroidota bacterium]|jgi:nucleoside-diphosphate-sugar epimerase
MVLFTGAGAVYEEFVRQEPAEHVSLRRTTDADLISRLSVARVIVHNAARIQCEDTGQAVRDNFLPTLRLVSLCRRYCPQVRLLYLGSMSYLGEGGRVLPLREQTPYAYSKYLGELLCLAGGLAMAQVVRFSTLFYENPSRDGLSFLIREAVTRQSVRTYNGGRACRDFIPLDTAVGCLRRLMAAPPVDRVVNIASGRETSFAEVVAMLRERVPGLAVSDVTYPAEKSVLSDFSGIAMPIPEPIGFTLAGRMDRYIKRIREGAA